MPKLATSWESHFPDPILWWISCISGRFGANKLSYSRSLCCFDTQEMCRKLWLIHGHQVPWWSAFGVCWAEFDLRDLREHHLAALGRYFTKFCIVFWMDPLIHFHVTLTVVGLLFEQHITGPGVHLTPSDESTTKRMQFFWSATWPSSRHILGLRKNQCLPAGTIAPSKNSENSGFLGATIYLSTPNQSKLPKDPKVYTVNIDNIIPHLPGEGL